jgi:hypothetical protein
MEAVQPGLSQTYRDLARTYRELASQCLAMAARDPWPGSLLMRARALDATADDVERPERLSAFSGGLVSRPGVLASDEMLKRHGRTQGEESHA